METGKKTKWVIDPAHTEVHFRVKHLVISTVTGSFEKFEGTVLTEGDNFENAAAEFSADVDSINTNQPDREAHLKSPDFFDAANHPKITFKSKSITKKSEDEYIIKGDITIRGTTKEITLNVEHGGIVKDHTGATRAGFEITGKLLRKEFGLMWDALTETGGVIVSNEVKLLINAELVKQ